MTDDLVRASDGERDVALAVLAEAHAAGRLNQVEFEQRSAATLAARTRGDLSAQLSDLPQEPQQSRLTDLADALLAEAGRQQLSRGRLAAFLLARS